MARCEAKTRVEADDITALLGSVTPPGRQGEARWRVAIFREVSGFEPRLRGPGIVGFGRYKYTYACGHSGEAPATGFSPRKAELTICGAAGYEKAEPILAELGQHRIGKACLYLKRLDGINEDALRRLIRSGLDEPATR